MTYSDLPANWLDLPLTDPTLAADVVDLYVSVGDRRQGVLSALLCDSGARFLAAIHLDLPERAPLTSPKSCAKALAPLIPALQLRPDGALLLALGRPTRDPTSDRAWLEAARKTCETASIHLLAFYIATPTHLYVPSLPVTPDASPSPAAPPLAPKRAVDESQPVAPPSAPEEEPVAQRASPSGSR
ncbi:hypothetical protein [Kribbella sp. CA-293567]|uniref:hypothetical protein n=1 Tax=Kribbella sp. CA-293567 TaxID=3002436 RepID=UPI0022DE48AD|nr:hypothetical protein [Kribbella sp. CA-293567]WBQ08093.1 hypothetical protein OX958_15110 [Kribbella sp. CA-293567]